jgi:hypothetical protein
MRHFGFNAKNLVFLKNHKKPKNKKTKFSTPDSQYRQITGTENAHHVTHPPSLDHCLVQSEVSSRQCLLEDEENDVK